MQGNWSSPSGVEAGESPSVPKCLGGLPRALGGTILCGTTGECVGSPGSMKDWEGHPGLKSEANPYSISYNNSQS